jgi:hypothetical protein
MLDGLESGYWSQAEYARVRSYLRRTHGAIRGWWRYLESPEAARFYEHHKARLDREIQLGLRRPPKDPNSRPWRKARPGEPGTPNLRTPNPQNPEPEEPAEPEEPGEPGPGSPK